MTEPQTAAEYARRFRENQTITGFGVGNVYIHMPCPFCAAPEFLVYELLQVASAMAAGASCHACGRAMAAIVDRDHFGNAVRFEFVQTAGPEAPPWAPMRRVDGIQSDARES